MARLVASGYLRSRVVIRPLCRMKSGTVFAFIVCLLSWCSLIEVEMIVMFVALRGFQSVVLQPSVQSTGDQRHDRPGQKRHHTGIEDEIVHYEIPGADKWSKGESQRHDDRYDTEVSGDG